MKRLILSFVAISMLFSTACYAQTRTSSSLPIIAEEDGDPSLRFRSLKVPNGTLTNNSDGTVSITTGSTYTAGDALTLNTLDFDFDGGATPGGSLGGT